jgi:hypothetical protein
MHLLLVQVLTLIDGQFGLKGVGYSVDAPGLGESKPITGPYKASGYGDLKESVLRSQIHLLVKEVLDEVKQPELKAALDAADEAYDENKYKNVDDFLKTYKGKYKNEVENALKSKYEG